MSESDSSPRYFLSLDRQYPELNLILQMTQCDDVTAFVRAQRSPGAGGFGRGSCPSDFFEVSDQAQNEKTDSGCSARPATSWRRCSQRIFYKNTGFKRRMKHHHCDHPEVWATAELRLCRHPLVRHMQRPFSSVA